MASNKLEQIALQQRDILIAKNTYNKIQEQQYKATHTRALADQQTPNAGKGTGVFLDTYNGGSDIDVNGDPMRPGSGRLQNKTFNLYNENNGYTAPDTSGNIGQIIID